MAVKSKICGITKISEARMLNHCKADYAGFVMFYEKSKRYNTVENAWQVLRYLDQNIQKVAVTVSPTLEQLHMLERMDFQVLQVHGELYGEVLRACRLPIWRAYHIEEGIVPETYAKSGKITGYVLDGAKPGSGKTFDWRALQAFDRGDKQLILAGGLTPDNVEDAIEALHPDVVDVSSGVEGIGGKDPAKIQAFIRKVKGHE